MELIAGLFAKKVHLMIQIPDFILFQTFNKIFFENFNYKKERNCNAQD